MLTLVLNAKNYIDKRKGSFVLSYNKDADWKSEVFLHTSFLEKQANTSENKCRTMFTTRKQTCMRSLELFWPCINLAKIPTALFPPNPSITGMKSMTFQQICKERITAPP